MAQEFPKEIHRKIFSFFDEQKTAARMLMVSCDYNETVLLTILSIPSKENLALITTALSEKLYRVFCKGDFISDALKGGLETFKACDLADFHAGVLAVLLLASSGQEQKIICLQQLRLIFDIIPRQYFSYNSKDKDWLLRGIDLLETSEQNQKEELISKIRNRVNSKTNFIFSREKAKAEELVENSLPASENIQKIKHYIETVIKLPANSEFPFSYDTTFSFEAALKLSIIAQHKEIIALMKQLLQSSTNYTDEAAWTIQSFVNKLLSTNPDLSKDEELVAIITTSLAANKNFMLNLKVLVSLVKANSSLAQNMAVVQQVIKFMHITELACTLAVKLIILNPGLAFVDALVAPLAKRIEFLPVLIEANPGFVNEALVRLVIASLQARNSEARSNRNAAYKALHLMLKNPLCSVAPGWINSLEPIDLLEAFIRYDNSVELLVFLYEKCVKYKSIIHKLLTKDIISSSSRHNNNIPVIKKLGEENITCLGFTVIIKFAEIFELSKKECPQDSKTCSLS